MGFLLNSHAQGVPAKNKQSTQTRWCGAQCSCIDVRPALGFGLAVLGFLI